MAACWLFLALLASGSVADVFVFIKYELLDGSLRAHSAEFMEKRPAAATARVLSAVANRLPLMRDFDSSEFESLWRDVIEGIPSGSPELDAIGPARAKAGICMDDVESFRFSTMRRCLEWRHDEMIRDLNEDYWNAQVGS